MAKAGGYDDGGFLPDGIRPGLFFFGDNLEGLQKLAAETIDLIYLDPPFNSKKQWSGIVEDDREQAEVAFKDTWTMGDIKPEWLNRIGAKEQYDALREVAEAVRATSGESAMAYILYMAIRLIEMQRVLKPTGSIYYHCNPVMSHGVKLLMDAIFGADNFQNEIVWKRTNSPKSQAKTWGVQRDCLLFYAKSGAFVFNKAHTPYTKEQLRAFRNDDNDGKGAYQTIALIAGSSQKSPNRKTFDFRGVSGAWLYKKETLEQWWREGKIKKTPHGYRLKDYLAERKGAPVSDIWTDENVAPIQAKERLGYPTQKPEALLERIILASSNPGDIVLDPFAGSGTACAVAEKLGRLRIGMDLNETAAITATLRLQKVMDERNEQKAEPLLMQGSEDIELILEQGAAESIKNAAALPNIAGEQKTERGEHWRARLCAMALQKQHGRCLGCGKWAASGDTFECDHIEPKSRGGLLTEDNTQALCRKCNGKKGSGTMADLWAK
ncbi:MAG: DNA methyltransferase, partial [Gammaproteobacteria bacterium]